MLDFLLISSKSTKKDVLEIKPKFKVKKSSDLMIRGRDFYAVWDEENGMWSTDQDRLIDLIDKELRKVAEEKKHTFDGQIKVQYMWDSDSGSIERWNKYVQKQLKDNYHPLDETIVFANTKTDKKNYASKRLDYSLEAGSFSAWDELIGTLYAPEERAKIEWVIGAIISGDSKKLQKFMVMYGDPGTGKSTIINVIEKLFKGYTATFDAKVLGSANATFALEPFKKNPLVAIQHDGDLSRIEDNTRLNSIASHETMSVNVKFASMYEQQFHSFMIMGTNKPVKITDAKSGIMRRLIDVTPTGKTLPRRRYDDVVSKVDFELGAIAAHCLDVYKANPHRYDTYTPITMLSYSNDFYNFVIDNMEKLSKGDGIGLEPAYEMYKVYCENANVPYPASKRVFKQELSSYFDKTYDRYEHYKGYFKGFKRNKFMVTADEYGKDDDYTPYIIEFGEMESIFDKECKDCPAQLANLDEKPIQAWDYVKTTLSDIDTHKIHYVRVPLNHIVIDFDLKDENGEKSFELNLMAASKWPATYAETSKSGRGIHLHYIYTGDPTKLKSEFAPGIEIKVFTGKSSLRRKLYLCNNLPIATINSNLPIREEKRVLNFTSVKSEMGLRTLIDNNIRKKYHPGTKPSIDFIFKILEDAYNSDFKFDVSDMKPHVLNFAMGSTHQAKYCVDLVSKMHFKSEQQAEGSDAYDDDTIVFFDVEVFPNLFVVVYKYADKDCVTLINPGRDAIDALLKLKLVGFNCRRYDNHILYAAWQGYSNYELYHLSQRIIGGDRNAFFGNAYNLSYTDIYDFSSKKQSLKKFEIELGIHHQELGLKWDEEVPEDKWQLVAEYCKNDVVATEAVFKARSEDFKARLILADIACMTPNDTTNSLTTRIIFGDDRKPQWSFNYRDMSKPVRYSRDLQEQFGEDYIFHIFDDKGQPTYEVYTGDMELPEGFSVLPFFPGYTYENGVSTYMGEKIGEGGRVYSEPGAYSEVALSDIASQHPHSIIAEVLFGPKYTKRFKDIVDLRILVKHGEYDKARGLLGGALERHLGDGADASALALALKIAINSVYGLTKASFEHAFRDPRNKDNIVAKRGALFMTNLKAEVQKRGFIVAHIKTDSIKVPNATKELIDFIYKYGLEYGYKFEHEASYEKLCLTNDASYVAKHMSCAKCEELYGYIPSDNVKAEKKGKLWTCKTDTFKEPYTFKTLFSHEPLEFSDFCVTNAVSTAIYLDFNEEKYKKVLDELGISYDPSKILDEDTLKYYLRTAKVPKSDIEAIISDQKNHDYRFVGKVGRFCPMKPGTGGGLLMREGSNGGFSNASGGKGYRWRESEQVKNRGLTGEIDTSYFENMAYSARLAIEKYCDFTWFSE